MVWGFALIGSATFLVMLDLLSSPGSGSSLRRRRRHLPNKFDSPTDAVVLWRCESDIGAMPPATGWNSRHAVEPAV